MDIATIRKGLGLSQAEFAEKVGVKESYISHLETGYRKPSLKLARQIEMATGAKGLVEAVVAEKLGAAA